MGKSGLLMEDGENVPTICPMVEGRELTTDEQLYLREYSESALVLMQRHNVPPSAVCTMSRLAAAAAGLTMAPDRTVKFESSRPDTVIVMMGSCQLNGRPIERAVDQARVDESWEEKVLALKGLPTGVPSRWTKANTWDAFRIAKALGCHETTVYRAVNQLRERGMMVRERSPKAIGRWSYVRTSLAELRPRPIESKAREIGEPPFRAALCQAVYDQLPNQRPPEGTVIRSGRPGTHKAIVKAVGVSRATVDRILTTLEDLKLIGRAKYDIITKTRHSRGYVYFTLEGT